jgi:diguanylate cyclase (GGDEF)-like protein
MIDSTRSQQFEASLVPRNAAALRLEVWLGIFLVPGFWLLDWFVVPDQVWLTLPIRLLCTAFGLLILARERLTPGWTARHVAPLAFFFSLLVAWSIALMCFLHHGYESPYYAGVNLLLMAVGLLFSWPKYMSIGFNLAIYAFYMAPLILGLTPITDLPIALSNQFFLISTGIITVASQIHRRRLERREFEAQIAQEHLLAEVQAMATIDWLTNLYNRRHFFRLGEDEIVRARRYRHPISVLMIDIDHFKAINDNHGHTVGDEVLAAIASRLSAGLRQSDIAGRYGGEEFAIVLPETDLATATQVVAERLRDAIAGHPIETARGPLQRTISVGVAGVDLDNENLLDALSRADVALYAAKHAGRNRVVSWSPKLDPLGSLSPVVDE